MKSIRNFAPITLAILSIVMAAYQFIQVFSSAEWKNPSAEMVTKWENQVQALREALPSDVHRAGYVDQSMLGENSIPFDANEFQLMQYSVAPVVLKIGIGEAWIIGNFDNDVDFRPWLDEKLDRYDVQSFGFGLHLIHKLGE